MTKANSEYFELSLSPFSNGESFFGIMEADYEKRRETAKRLSLVLERKATKDRIGIIKAMQEGDVEKTDSSLPLQEIGTMTFFLHDSFYSFLKTLGMDELWDTYPVELYEKDGKTRIPNYHYGLIVKQHVGFVTPPWATPRTPEDSLYGSPGISPLKGTWFNEAELKDDRLFCINQGPPTFRADIKEKIEKTFPAGIEWKNLRDT